MSSRQEQLSALVDGELPEQESDKLLAALVDEPALRDAWSRYQMIGTAIRRGVPERHDPGLAARVAAEIALVEPEGDDAPLPEPSEVSSSGRLRRAVSGLAMAASVAAVALIGVRYLGAPDAGPGALPVANVAPSAIQAMPVATTMATASEAPLDEQRLNDYLKRHNELALGGGGLSTLPPYVRVVSLSTSSVQR